MYWILWFKLEELFFQPKSSTMLRTSTIMAIRTDRHAPPVYLLVKWIIFNKFNKIFKVTSESRRILLFWIKSILFWSLKNKKLKHSDHLKTKNYHIIISIKWVPCHKTRKGLGCEKTSASLCRADGMSVLYFIHVDIVSNGCEICAATIPDKIPPATRAASCDLDK